MRLVLAPDPVLRTVCAPVHTFDGALAARMWEMLRLMYAENGRGLAAPQVGWTARLFVTDITWKEGTPRPNVFINPQITFRSDRMAARTEQCLSIPNIPCHILRADQIEVAWQDLSGAKRSARFDGPAAICIQHEYDHLDGILITDKVAA